MVTHTPKQSNQQKAFTLIELSIVLVIIGLIVGGVLVGTDLVEAAKMKKEASTFEKYNTAITTFRLKYNCLPGDCATATNFFPAAAPSYSLCSQITTPNVGDETCNGNGDGKIYGYNGSDPNLYHSSFESVRIWQQLAASGLIDGQYSGVRAPLFANAGVNMPASKVNEVASVFLISGARFSGPGSIAGSVFAATASYDHLYIVGTNTRYSSGILVSGDYGGVGPGLTTRIAQQLDTKFDDIKPDTGIITAAHPNQWNNGIYCTSYTVANGNQYNTSYTADVACPVYWKAQF